jgi:hypothetical protein
MLALTDQELAQLAIAATAVERDQRQRCGNIKRSAPAIAVSRGERAAPGYQPYGL